MCLVSSAPSGVRTKRLATSFWNAPSPRCSRLPPSLHRPARRRWSMRDRSMAARYTRIIGTGSALPTRAVSNDELARDLATRGIETSDEWIVARTGIRQRYIAEAGLTTAALGTRAAVAALEDARVDAKSIDLLIVAT